MLTPQEAESHVFPKASFGGYNMLQVDNFLDSLIEDYRTLYQENISLKNKMKVLVDKVEEYRATEDAMRMTLHSAQKMADAMVKEGEAKKQAAIDQAVSAVEARSQEVRAQMEQEEQAVRTRLEGIQKDLADEQARLEAARAATTAYVAQLKELYTKQIQYIGSLSSLTAETAQPQAAPAPAAQPAEEPVVTVPRNSRKRWPRISRPPWPRFLKGPPSPPPPAGTWGTPGSLTRFSSGRITRSSDPGESPQDRIARRGDGVSGPRPGGGSRLENQMTPSTNGTWPDLRAGSVFFLREKRAPTSPADDGSRLKE